MLQALFDCYMAGVTWNCCNLGACSVYTIQPSTSSQCHFMQSHIRWVQRSLAVTCHLHLFCATVVTQGWNRYWNKSHTESWPRRKKIFCCYSNLQPFILVSITSLALYRWAIPAPSVIITVGPLSTLSQMSRRCVYFILFFFFETTSKHTIFTKNTYTNLLANISHPPNTEDQAIAVSQMLKQCSLTASFF